MQNNPLPLFFFLIFLIPVSVLLTRSGCSKTSILAAHMKMKMAEQAYESGFSQQMDVLTTDSSEMNELCSPLLLPTLAGN